MAEEAKVKKNAHLWVRHPEDWYVEPSWCNEALFARVKFSGQVFDPCCGFGRVLDAAAATGLETYGMDIVARGAEKNHRVSLGSFLTSDYEADNIACNPPYKYDEAWLKHALERSRRLTAVLLRAQWANAAERSRWLESLPLRYVLALAPRPSMPPGVVIEAGEKVGSGTTDYSWFVFEHGYSGKPEFGWARRPARISAKKPARSKKK